MDAFNKLKKIASLNFSKNFIDRLEQLENIFLVSNTNKNQLILPAVNNYQFPEEILNLKKIEIRRGNSGKKLDFENTINFLETVNFLRDEEEEITYENIVNLEKLEEFFKKIY